MAQAKMGVTDPHHPVLLALLAKELGCSPADIVDFELNVCDTQPGVIGGERETPACTSCRNPSRLG